MFHHHSCLAVKLNIKIFSCQINVCPYVFVLDPDAPSRTVPTYREWLHWCVGNVPGVEVSKGQVLAAYVGAGPPKGTSEYR